MMNQLKFQPNTHSLTYTIKLKYKTKPGEVHVGLKPQLKQSQQELTRCY